MSANRNLFELYIFDLDGTLADTRNDLAASVNHALDKVGRNRLDIETVTRFVGDGAKKLLERSLGPGASAQDVATALEAFLAHYRTACLVSTRLYDGVREALRGLEPTPLAVLTNKPRFHSLKILHGLGIDGYFRWIQCGDDEWPKKPDPGGLLHILKQAGCERDRALFIGDSAVDIATARAAGVRMGFVTYGFRPDAVDENHRVDILLSDLRQLLLA